MTSPRSILVVGAGLAGARCAETLRAEGYDGELVLVGEEPFAPYERPGEIVILPALPASATGKVLKQQLRNLAQARTPIAAAR